MSVRCSFRFERTLVSVAGAMVLLGCQQHSGETTASTSPASSEPAGEGACRLLQPSEVRSVFSGAERGKPDDSRKEYGISTCVWHTSRGMFAAQTWDSSDSSAMDEARGLTLGALDPLKGQAAQESVRYETVQGIGEQAVAVIEPKDAQRGVLEDFVMLVVQQGNRILVLTAPELARGERSKALQDLETLGKNAVGRL